LVETATTCGYGAFNSAFVGFGAIGSVAECVLRLLLLNLDIDILIIMILISHLRGLPHPLIGEPKSQERPVEILVLQINIFKTFYPHGVFNFELHSVPIVS